MHSATFPHLRDAKRILVLGSPGAGKSTLAAKLGRILELPVVHLDRLFWTPGWVARDRPAFRALIERALDRPRWVIDGNYSATLPLRLERADAAVHLDFPRIPCLLGALRRILAHHGATRPDMAPGCPERFDLEFLRYIWDFPRDNAPRVARALETSAGRIPVVTLRRRGEVRGLLRSLPSIGRPGSPAGGARGGTVPAAVRLRRTPTTSAPA